MKFYSVLTKRAGMLAAGAVVVFAMAGCGNIPATPTTGTGGTGASPTDTAMMAAPTGTTAMAAPSDTAMMAPTGTTAMAAPSDTAMMSSTGTSAMPGATSTDAMAGTTPTSGAAGGGPTTAGATPVSDYKPGAHAKSVPAPAKLTSGGTFTVGSDASYPPQEYIGGDGNPVGLDIDIANEIASRMGLTLKVVNFKFDDIIPALNAGQFDVVISAMTITDERKKVVNFVPYLDAGQAVLVKKGNPKGIKTLEDLSGLTAVAEQGTTEEQTLKTLNETLTKANKPPVKVLIYPNDTDAVDQLRVGRADATLHDSPVAAYYGKINPDFEVAIPDFDSAPEGVAVAQNNQAMMDAINKAIGDMKSDGTLDAIKAKWGVK